MRYWDARAVNPTLRSSRSLATLSERTSTQLLIPPCLPKATVVTPAASQKRIHAVPLPAAAESSRVDALAGGCNLSPTQTSPGRALGRSRKHPEPCIAHGEAGAGLWLRTTYLSAFNVSTQVIYGLPFSTICHRLNDLQARGVSSPRGLYPAGHGETLHWEVRCSFSRGKGLECKEKRSLWGSGM